MTRRGSGEVAFRLRGRFGALSLDCAARLPGAGATALMGPSGSGKTTLLRCLAGLDRAAGHVQVGDTVWQNGRHFTPPHQRGVGYVFQEASLLSHLSVLGNLDYAWRRARQTTGPGFHEVVEQLGISDLLSRAVTGLSGGERQRVAIARAVVSRPALLLMDEPLSSLDAEAKSELLDFLETLIQGLNLPVLYVTHDAAEARRLAPRTLSLRSGILSPARATAGFAGDAPIRLATAR